MPMETSEIVTMVGVVITLVISSISLIISIKNRRNSLREHLYKEQLKVYLEIQKVFMDIEHAAINYNELNDNEYNLIRDIEQKVKNLEKYIDYHEIILPNNIISLSYGYVASAEKFCKQALKELNNPSKKLFNKWMDAYEELSDEIRNEIGTDALSDENRKLHRLNGRKSESTLE